MARALREITDEERRARLARRHHLAPRSRAATPVEVAGDLLGLHGTTASSVFLSAAARLKNPTVTGIEEALYETGTVVRMLGMRRTMFVVPQDLAPIIHAACTRAIAIRERQRLVQMLEQAGIAREGATWLVPVERSLLRALAARGEATAAELGKDEPKLRTQIRLAEGEAYEGSVSVGTRLLFVLGAEGRVVRGRPLGSWTSSQFRWSAVRARRARELEAWPVERAQAELIRRWLASFGPATLADVVWWTGLTIGAVKRALDQVATAEVNVESGTALVLADDLDEVRPGAPWAALLPALDPTVMGWFERSWYLGRHREALFDRSGNAGPTVWWDGRVVGGWGQRPEGEIAFRVLEDIGAEGLRAVETAVARLQAWLGPVRVTPGFRTPLEKSLTGVAG
ncbi:MAG: winged helix DNA-binding domain-containing protein [Candidatus Dormibacteraeota bacterium]|nr:winged helix DNA-binding domain-containing protein [Candidatus Dormibacteraeota bacterium]